MSRFNYETPQENIKIDYNQKLGKGSSCCVYKGILKNTPVAVKIPLDPSKSAIEALFEEINIMLRLEDKPQLVRLLGFAFLQNTSALITELAPGGNLFDLLQGEINVPWPERYNIAEDISKGIDYLHHQRIAHRDLKSQNIFLDERRHAKIGDFGISQLNDTTIAPSPKEILPHGTIFWAAPELLQPGLPCLFAADIYALGMIFFELLARKIPFQERGHWSIEKLSQSIIAGDRPNLPIGPTDFKKLIQRCWSQRVSDRPLAGGVVQSLEHISTTPTIPMDFTTGEPGEETSQKKTASTFFNANAFLEDTQFIQHVLSGKQEEAEKLLKKTDRLARDKITIIDLANRKFPDITVLQYAMWALDWRMYNMIAKYLSPDEVQRQAKHQEALTVASNQGKHYQLNELLQDRLTTIQNIPAHIREIMANTSLKYTIRRSTSSPSLNANITPQNPTKANFNPFTLFNLLIEQRQKALLCWNACAPMPTQQQRTDELLQGPVETPPNVRKVMPINPQNQSIRRSSSASFFDPRTRIPRENFNREQRRETLLHRSPSVPRCVKRT